MEELRKIGKIQKARYEMIVPNLDTDEVVITIRQKRHINERHHSDFDTYHDLIPEILYNPEYILEDKKRPDDTVLLLKSFLADDETLYFRLCLRLHTPQDPPEHYNSIITFWRTRQEEYQRLIKNRKHF